MVACLALRSASQAQISWRNMKLLPMRRWRHWADNTANSKSSFSGFEGFVERAWGMRVEVVQNYPDLQCLGEIPIDQSFHLVSKILFGAPVGHRHVTPTLPRAKEHKEIRRAFAVVVIVIASPSTGRCWKRLAHLTD